MTSLGTLFTTWFSGRFVGADDEGNRYYRGRARKGNPRERRWVIYAGEIEASRVPSEWHAWLHHVTDEAPLGPRLRHAWQQPHQPNKTGTPEAYRPAGSLLMGGKRAPASADYQPWTPR
jgi:NADH:ubiquinone oxidoreductase subunit